MSVDLYPDSSGKVLDETGSSVDLTAAELRGPLGMFGEYRVSERRQIVELKSTYGLSALRDKQTVAAGGAITNTGGEYLLSTSTTTASSALLESKEKGRYIPGVEAEMGIGVRLDHTFTSDQYAEWGYFDSANGFGFGSDATGIYTFITRASSKTKTYQSSWSVDKLDGTGGTTNPTGHTLDLASGNIFQIDFTWYGYGVIQFSVVIADPGTGRQLVAPVHRFRPNGTNSVQDPNLPIAAYVDNGSTVIDIDLYVGGRQFSVYTDYKPNERTNGAYRLSLGSIGTTFLPLVSFQKKAAFKGVSVKMESFDITTDQDIIWELRYANTLTSASFGTPADVTAAETACDVDIVATATSGGEYISGGLIKATGNGSKSAGEGGLKVNMDVPDDGNVTLMVRRVTGTGATASAFLNWKEEW